MSYTFVYRELPIHRDSAHYMDLADIGTKSTHGPNFFEKIVRTEYNQWLAYNSVETALSEEQWERLCENGLQQDMVDTLLSYDGVNFENYIRESEIGAICELHGITQDEAAYCVSQYPGPVEYFDNGIVLCVYNNLDEAIYEKMDAFGRNFTPQRIKQYIEEDKDMLVLGCGKVVEFGQ